PRGSPGPVPLPARAGEAGPLLNARSFSPSERPRPGDSIIGLPVTPICVWLNRLPGLPERSGGGPIMRIAGIVLGAMVAFGAGPAWAGDKADAAIGGAAGG